MDYRVAGAHGDRLHDLTEPFEIDENALRKWKKEVSVIGQTLHSHLSTILMLEFQT